MIPTYDEMYDALLLRQGKTFQESVKNATVAVCGLGGLGSNISISLARAGVGNLILIDFDKVDITNLHRQQYKANQIGINKTEALKANLLEIAPYVNITTHTVKLNEENIPSLLKDADVICEAFDNPVAKATIVDTFLTKMQDKYLVAASGMAGLDSPNTIKTKKITDKFYLSGDFVTDVKKTESLVSSRVMLCAAHQAHNVLRILNGKLDV